MVDVLVVAILTGLCGVTGGYWIGASALLQHWRAPKARARDVFDYTLEGALGSLEPAFGAVAGDDGLGVDGFLLAPPMGKDRRRLVRRWQRNYWATCNSCSGSVFVPLALAAWTALSVFLDGQPPIPWAAYPVTLVAGLAVHLAVTEAGNRGGIW